MEKNGADLIAIGKVTRKKEIIISVDGEKKVLENKGYEHFKKQSF